MKMKFSSPREKLLYEIKEAIDIELDSKLCASCYGHFVLGEIPQKEKTRTEEQKYNGWTNYATWRINLEIFDGYDPEGQEVDHESLKDMAEEIIFSVGNVDETSLVGSYASAFISDVNWHEIAEHINEERLVADE
jgi:hypothetical protein